MLLTKYFPIFIFLTLFSEILGNETISDAIPTEWIGKLPHKTLIINEGDPIEISCLTEKSTIFYYPKNKLASSFKISQEKTDSKFILHIFRRPKAVRGDTAFYCCFTVDNTTINLDNVNPEFLTQNKPLNLTYIYVRSKKYAFAIGQSRNVYSWTKGEKMIIFCRPTSPDIHVDLEYHSRGNRKVITSDKRVAWEPKYGFIVQDIQMVIDDGLYVCKAKHNGHTQELLYSILIGNDSLFDSPFIRDDGEPIKRGNTVDLDCTVILNNITKYELNWITPRKNDKINRKVDSRKADAGMVVTNQLSIINFTESDEGNYKCDLVNLDKSKPEIKSKNKYLKISDPKPSYINITYDGAEKDFVRYTGDDLYIIVMVDAFPKPKVQWLNPKDEEIHTSGKLYAVNHYFYPRLIIENIELTDAGVYILRVSNEEEIKMMKFTLDVKTP